MVAITQRPVLVLNKSWQAINVTNVQNAIVMLFSTYDLPREDARYKKLNGHPKAHVIDPENDFQTYSWTDWSEMKPEEGELTISGGHHSFRIPEVILLTSYDQLPQTKVQFSRRQLYKRDGFQCQYCGARPGSEELSIDHILPRSKGGVTSWTNCVLSCVECNSKKSDRLLEHSGMKLLSVPKKPKFNLIRCDKAMVPTSWKNFISEAYWNVEMPNDNPDE
ncbi:MAG: HNH endonuclease [Candidatus Thorarchaeota archaeon]|jgi:hypothetical protein